MKYYWKRNLLLIAAFAVVTVILLVIASLQDNVETAVSTLGSSIGADLKIRKKAAKFDSYHQKNFYSKEVTEGITKRKDVDRIDYMTMSNVVGEKVKAVHSTYRDMSQESADMMGIDYFTDDEERAASELTVIGVSDIKKAWEFEKRNAQIIEGRGFTAEDKDKAVAVVSKRFLKWNFLELGDEITLIDNTNPSAVMTLKIVGIHSESYESEATADSEMNFIYVPIEQELAFSGNKVFDTTLHVNNPENLNQISSDLKKDLKKATGEEFVTIPDKLTYLMASSPMKGVQKTCRTMFFVVYGMLLLMLLLITGRLIVGRKREIGTWLALGEHKGAIVRQMLAEILFPVFCGMALGGMAARIAERQIGAAVAGVLTSFKGIVFQIALSDMWIMAGLTLLAGAAMVCVIMFGITRKKPKELL